MTISFNSGSDHTARFLIFNLYMEGQGLGGSNSFDLSAELRFINNQVYQKLVINETISNNGDFVQLPSTPRGTGSTSSHVNFHPTTQSAYLVMNGDQLVITCDNMEDGSSLRVRMLAYTRTRVPNIDVTGGTLTTSYNNIG